MDWEHFFRYGFNPALKSLQDYQDFMRQSYLSRQQHGQRMKELGSAHGMRMVESEYDYKMREYLMNVNADIERSLAMDKEVLQRGRLQFSNDLMVGRENLSHKNQMELARLYNDGGLKRANVYKDIAKINAGLMGVNQYDPKALPQVNLTTWSNLAQHNQTLQNEINQNELYMTEIRQNPLFDKIHRGTMTERGFVDWDEEQFSWYKEQLEEIEKREKLTRQLRTAFLMTNREIVKFAADAKIGNPITMDMPEVQQFLTTQVGFPLPVNLMKPQSQTKDMADHYKLIEIAIMNTQDLPPDSMLIKQGYDVNWMKTNWPQYREFYRNRLQQNLSMLGQDVIGDLSKPMKKLGELLSTFFF